MPASSVRIPDDEILAAFRDWRKRPDGRTAQDVSEGLGISKSTLYKVAGQAGLVDPDNPDITTTHREHLIRIESMLEQVLDHLGVAPPAPVEAPVGGLRRRVA